MTIETKQMFEIDVTFNLKISTETLLDVICGIGQGSTYWCSDFAVGHLPVDEDNVVQLPNEQWSYEGCAAWNHDINENSPIVIKDHLEDETYKFTVKDLVNTIQNICCNKSDTHESYCKTIREAFINEDMGMIDAIGSDIIAQNLAFKGRCEYG